MSAQVEKIPLYFVQVCREKGGDYIDPPGEQHMVATFVEADAKARELLGSFPIVRVLKEEATYYKTHNKE